jgi:hypothetical protein
MLAVVFWRTTAKAATSGTTQMHADTTAVVRPYETEKVMGACGGIRQPSVLLTGPTLGF